MDHEVIPCSSKICDWPLNLSQDHFGLHQEKNVRVTMQLEISERPIFRSILFHCHGPTCFVVGEGREVLWLQMSRDHDRDLPNIYIYIYGQTFFIVTREEEGEKFKHEENSRNCHF
jgi:hypothetical protein